MSLEEKLPERTVVITDISQLSTESQELFGHYGWTLKDFQDKYHSAMVLGQRLKKHSDGLLVQTRDNKGYEFDTALERVLGDKAKTGEDGVTPEKMGEMLAAVAVKYFELLAKKAPVSINGIAKEEWGFFPLERMTNMDKVLFGMLAQGYRHRALSPDQPFQYSARTAQK